MEREDRLDPADRAIEALLMGLRIGEGVDLDRIALLADGAPPIDPRALDRIVQHGLAERAGSRLRITEAGMPVLEAILREIVA